MDFDNVLSLLEAEAQPQEAEALVEVCIVFKDSPQRADEAFFFEPAVFEQLRHDYDNWCVYDGTYRDGGLYPYRDRDDDRDSDTVGVLMLRFSDVLFIY